MKHYNLNIINSNEKILTFNAFEPESDDESIHALSNINSTNDVIAYFPIKPAPCINPLWFNTVYSKCNIDFLFVNWCGTILQTDRDIPVSSDKIHICNKANCVIALKSGTAKKYNINIGDSVVHHKLNRFSDNSIICDNIKFQTITKNTYSKINADKIIFF